MKRSTVVVAVSFLVLLVAAVALMLQRPERGMRRVSLADLPKERIDRLVFGGKNAVELGKESGVWKLANGKVADASSVARLIDALGNIKSSDQLTGDRSRFGEYDLDAERGTPLTAYAGSTKVAELVVGKDVAGGVAMAIGGTAFRVGTASQGLFVRTPSAWREHRLFDEPQDDATRLEVRLAGAAPYALVKKDGVWAVEDPRVLPAGFRFDPETARALVSTVVALRARDFEERDPGAATTGLGEGADTLALTFTPAVVRTLRLGKAKGDQKDVYARVDGRDDVFTLFKGTAQSLRKSALDLRDLRLMSFDVSKAKALNLSNGKVALSFAKKDGVWRLVSTAEPRAAGFELDPAAVERRVTAIAATRALRIAAPQERAHSGVEAPTARLTVALAGGGSATLAFGKDAKDGESDAVFARGNADAEQYVVSPWTRDSLTSGIASFSKQAAPKGGIPGVDPSAFSKLPPEVRDSLMKQIAQKQREQQLLKQVEAQTVTHQSAPPKK